MVIVFRQKLLTLNRSNGAFVDVVLSVRNSVVFTWLVLPNSIIFLLVNKLLIMAGYCFSYTLVNFLSIKMMASPLLQLILTIPDNSFHPRPALPVRKRNKGFYFLCLFFPPFCEVEGRKLVGLAEIIVAVVVFLSENAEGEEFKKTCQYHRPRPLAPPPPLYLFYHSVQQWQRYRHVL